MPTEIAPQPTVAAPAATPPPAAPAAERPISSITQKPISEDAHKLFKMLEQSGDPMREETPAVPAAPAKVETPAAPANEEPPIKVSKRPAPKRPDLPVAAEPVAPVVTAPVAASPVDSKWEESLLDDEKAALEDARFAESVDPRHRGLADKMGKFFRDQKKYLEDHPDADENDAGYKKILATQPGLSAADKRAITTARIEQTVTKKHEGRFADLEQEIYTRDEEPKVVAESQQIRQHLAFNALPKQMLDILKEKGTTEGVKVLQKEYASELNVAGSVINGLVEDAAELLRITRTSPKTGRPLATAADKESHPKWEQHQRLVTLVNEACLDFQKTAPQSEQVRDGKWFVTRDEWARIPASARHQFWTFTNSEEHVREMINRAISWTPDAIARKIKEKDDERKAEGYVRQRAEVPPVPAPPVASTAAPSPRPGPAPAPNNAPAGQLSLGQQLAKRLAGE